MAASSVSGTTFEWEVEKVSGDRAPVPASRFLR